MEARLSREGIDGSGPSECLGFTTTRNRWRLLLRHEAWSEISIDAQFEASDTLFAAMLADLARALYLSA